MKKRTRLRAVQENSRMRLAEETSRPRPAVEKLAALTIAATLALGATGCSKDAECADFMTENAAFAAALQSAHEKDGLDGARKAFDEKKAELKKKWDVIKDVRGFQVTDETFQKLDGNRASALTDVCNLGDMKLCTDYTELLN